jgi:hypothetical protein
MPIPFPFPFLLIIEVDKEFVLLLIVDQRKQLRLFLIIFLTDFAAIVISHLDAHLIFDHLLLSSQDVLLSKLFIVF